jgi:hypothetical protein
MFATLARLLKDATAIEYGLVAALVAGAPVVEFGAERMPDRFSNGDRSASGERFSAGLASPLEMQPR